MSNEERAIFASTILVERTPADSANIFLSRLLESKGLNNQIGSFLFDYMMINRHYANKLKKILDTKGQSLNQSIDQYIKKESRHDAKYQNAKSLNNDHLGELGTIWTGILDDIREEIYISETFCNNMEKQLISPLKKCFDISKNKKYSNMLNSILELEKTAESVNLKAAADDTYASEEPTNGASHKLSLGLKHGHKKAASSSGLTNNEWALKSPEVSENFENFEFNRLLFLKDAFISFQNNLNYRYNENLKHNENLFSILVGFNPDDEIARFAREVSDIKPLPPISTNQTGSRSDIRTNKKSQSADSSDDEVEDRNSPPVANKSSSTPNSRSGISSVQKSGFENAVVGVLGTTAAAGAGAATIAGGENGKAANNYNAADLEAPNAAPQLAPQKSNPSTINSQSTDPKKRGGLRSKVGTLFGRKKNKKRHDSITSDSIVEDSPQPAQPTREESVDRQKDFKSSSNLKREVAADSAPVEEGAAAVGLKDKTINPRSSFIQKKEQDEVILHQPEPVAEDPALEAQQQQQQQQQQQKGTETPLSINQRPLIPNVKSSSSTSIPKASSNGAASEASITSKVGTRTLAPPPPPPTRKAFHESATTSENKEAENGGKRDRRDIQSKLFTNLTTAAIMDQGTNNQERLSFVGEEQAVLPPLPKNASFSVNEASKKHLSDTVSTNSGIPAAFAGAHENGSTASLAHSQTISTKPGNKFVHPDLNSSGLNASVSESIKVSLRDGYAETCQIIGEIALTYVKPPLSQLPYKMYLKLIDNDAVVEKLIPNHSFIEPVDKESTPTCKVFSLNPSQISFRTLGGLKYLVTNAESPVVVLPVWRFEPHQASCMISVKLSERIVAKLGQDSVSLDNFMISIALEEGVDINSAMSRPSGTFNKDKRRITWKYTEPVVLSKQRPEEKIVARFLTNGVGQESKKGSQAKFIIRHNEGGNYAVSDIKLGYNSVESNIIQGDSLNAGKWEDANTVKTFATNIFSAHAI